MQPNYNEFRKKKREFEIWLNELLSCEVHKFREETGAIVTNMDIHIITHSTVRNGPMRVENSFLTDVKINVE